MNYSGYIIVAWYKGVPYFVQQRKVINWYFYNNSVKVYKRIANAIAYAKQIKQKYAAETVKVYGINELYKVYPDNIRRWEKEETERILFSTDD